MSGLVHVTYEVLDGVFIGAPHEQAVRKRFTRFQTNITGLFESGNLTGDNIAQGRQGHTSFAATSS